MKLALLRSVPGLQVHYADSNRCLASRGQSLLIGDGTETGWQQMAYIPTPFVKQSLLLFPLANRLLRGGVHGVLPALDGWIAVAERQVFLISSSGVVHSLFSIPRGRRPLRQGLCVVNDTLYLGEYWPNPERDAVHIYNIHIPSGSKEIFYTFPAGTIRHIHTVIKDPYSAKLWISTGDKDNECCLLLLDSQTGQSELLGKGSQKWRVVSFAFRPEAVFWGTDNHLGENEVWCYERATSQTYRIGPVVGPVYYSTALEKAIIMGTTMEKGEGQQDGYGRLYAIDPQGNIQEIWKARKDRWPARLFGYGVFEFAAGQPSSNQFWLTAKGFTGGLRSILFELNV